MMEQESVPGTKEGPGSGRDFYQYSFAPLLLFTSDGYFDQGYSNYNAVAEFFKSVVDVDMLDNGVILFDRKNMRYDELLALTIQKRMTVTCCIDSHFTAFQVLSKDRIVYYDPLHSELTLITGEESCTSFTLYLLLKCAYADSQHIIEHKDYYTGNDSTPTRKLVYRIWNSLSTISLRALGVKMAGISLPLKKYMLINSSRDPSNMSTQATGNTCYFQVYLFALLCRVCQLDVTGGKITLKNEEKLQQTSIRIAVHLNQFYFDGSVLRPYTNNNFLIDFFRYEESRYYDIMQSYLIANQCKENFDYKQQYATVLKHFQSTPVFQEFKRYNIESKMPSALNTKALQTILDTDGATARLCTYNYFKFRAVNMMFGLHGNIIRRCNGFYEYNSLRKNILLDFYDTIAPPLLINDKSLTKFRDYYFMPQFEIGQRKLVEIHQYTYFIDMMSILSKVPDSVRKSITDINKYLIQKSMYSTNKMSNYEKQLTPKEISKDWAQFFHEKFMTQTFLQSFVSMGFNELNPKEKEQNALTQCVFYTTSLMNSIMYKQDYEFERECINQMAKSNMNKYSRSVDVGFDENVQYELCMKIGYGVTYSRYNTLLHYLNVIDNYWENPDINSIQLFGKDVRTILVIVCQKIVQSDHDYYHYGATIDLDSYNPPFDLLVANDNLDITPLLQSKSSTKSHQVVITDRVYGYTYLKRILYEVLQSKKNIIKSDDRIINLCLLSLLLDFGLYEEYSHLLNLDLLAKGVMDKRELQITISNLISDHDQHNQDPIQKQHVQDLIFEMSYKFIVNKHFNISTYQFKLINLMNSDPKYFQYIVLCKLYMSLCQINQSVELDYYKVKLDGEQRIIIPLSYSKETGEYLAKIMSEYYFYEKQKYICYDNMRIFVKADLQPDIHLYKVRLMSQKGIETMYRYIEVSNSFSTIEGDTIIFIAGNMVKVQQKPLDEVTIFLNKVPVLLGSMFFNTAISFIPCFKYADNQDVILLTSPHIYYHVDVNGQFNNHYYGMKHELIENIILEQSFIDANDCHQFKKYKLSELLTESKTVLYYPTFYLQTQGRRQIIALLDFAIKVRNISFFIYLMTFLNRTAMQIDFTVREGKTKKISGPWLQALKYIYGELKNSHYDSIISQQFFDINKYKDRPLKEFIDVICEHFTKYQKYINGKPQIVPSAKQKAFLHKIVTEPESFFFSEVGSGKSKVIVPLLCQMFLSNNVETHKWLSKGGVTKTILFIIVPEHLVLDAQQQAYRYCLNLNYKEQYKIFDDVFYMLNPQLRMEKMIFITSFNDFKKALTYDEICQKMKRHRENILLLIDEVDDFLDREKLIFNICQNRNNDFNNEIIDAYFQCCTAAYYGRAAPDVQQYQNPPYWRQFYEKSTQIHVEIQEKSKSINKSFGIFNEQSLKHCSTNIAQDIEGYKSLIGRPYESVNRAMPGSYYSDMERTIYLTYYIINEDVGKYSQLFQQERKFITFEYYKEYIKHIDFDELVYGNTDLRTMLRDHKDIKEGITQFLFKIIVRKIEIQDRSRSVNSIDVIFNFDAKGFTGTPFIDNYPTYEYIKNKSIEKIPDLIYKDFYLHSNNKQLDAAYSSKLKEFQGDNNHVMLKYVPSQFLESIADEEALLDELFRQDHTFNAIVDLCGVFKRLEIQGVKNAIKRANRQFKYIYHIDQSNGSDRILYVLAENDVQYDEEFFTRHSDLYKEEFASKVFFFIDNRNVIGKDIPFQFIYQTQYGKPLISTSLVVAHDVNDFSKIWQAMGRSRTMNQTRFIVYRKDVSMEQEDYIDIQSCKISKQLYVQNCDKKVVGNLSSIYQTLISLYNLSQNRFYYENELINMFILKMDGSIVKKLDGHLKKLRQAMESSFYKAIWLQILEDKLKVTDAIQVEVAPLLQSIISGIVSKKYEQQVSSEDLPVLQVLDFLSGEQLNLSELTYTKQQQKQKQQTTNKNQDNDTMSIFKKDQQINLVIQSPNYFDASIKPTDPVKAIMNRVLFARPICTFPYKDGVINVYPTYQFLYSQFIMPDHITREVQEEVASLKRSTAPQLEPPKRGGGQPLNNVRQNAEFALLSLGKDTFAIAMKNQFSKYDLPKFEMEKQVQYMSDEQGFILYRKPGGVQGLQGTPYEIQLYVVLGQLTKHEVAVNVLNYYEQSREQLEKQALRYGRNQGDGFICWRFIMQQMSSLQQ